MPEPNNAGPGVSPPKRSAGLVARRGLVRYSAVELLVALGLLLVGAPFVEHFRSGDLIEGVLITVVLVSAVLAVGGRHRSLAVALALVLPVIVGKWANHLWPERVPPVAFLAPGLLFILFVILRLLRFILGARRIDTEVLCAGIATYLMLGLLWSFAYILTARLDPKAFLFTVGPDSSHLMKGFTSLYFSFITLSTVGYGDIVPASSVARMLSMTEAVTGTLYMATLIARLVSLYSSSAATDQTKPGREP
jgi:hypothetical protein